MTLRRLCALPLLAFAACPASTPTPSPPPAPATPVVISIVGTNDLHGHVEKLPLLGDYLHNLRAARANDGAVLLLDAGDMFQGTLESNLSEGAPVISSYNELGYAAAAIGNHEFDFGPVGPASTPETPGDDPRGAIKQRAAQAQFPLLAANVAVAASSELIDWPNVEPAVIRDVGGVRVGIVGVTTEETPYTTMAANFEGLAMVPLVGAITGQARVLRDHGAQIVIVSAHAGGHCAAFDVPEQTESCVQDAEIFRVARGLERGLVDVIVAGHSHRGIAHRVNGIAIIESFAYGRAFGRVDLTVNPTTGEVSGVRVFPPENLCAEDTTCSYEGAPVAADARLAALLEPAFENARAVRSDRLGVTVVSTVKRAYGQESALGNLFTDLMLAARPDANIALANGGGLRADLPIGELTYGLFYEAMPFDNRFATVRLTGADLARLIARNLGGTHGVFSLAGARARATCDDDSLSVELFRTDGTAIADTDELSVVTSDFLASGGDGAFGHLGLPEGAIRIDSGPTIRDAMAAVLRQRKGELSGDALLDRDHPRLTYPGDRPVRCH